MPPMSLSSRTKWEVMGRDFDSVDYQDMTGYDMPHFSALLNGNALSQESLTAHFQPIFSANNGKVYGCEALARVDTNLAPHGIASLFESAREQGVVAPLDRLCRKAALEGAMLQGFAIRGERLFVNVCPETLMDEDGEPVAALVERLGLSRDKIIFEITEESAVHDYDLFVRAVTFYRQQGFQIAIDDFGVGYGGLKMLALIEPDYVKIDRHFIQDIERATVRRNLVDSIATVCHRLGIKVVAEGIENNADAKVLIEMGVEFLQGFGLARPAPLWPEPDTYVVLPQVGHRWSTNTENTFIGDISQITPTLLPNAPMADARQLFLESPALMGIPIVTESRCIGMLHRHLFFENQLSGPYGYGTALSTYRTVAQLAEGAPCVCVEATQTLEEVANMLRQRDVSTRADDICVSSNGKYSGTVAVSALLDAITQRALHLARGANPLSGLPGNDALRREIEKRIAQMMHFDVCYIDIDNFKPFNDAYGFDCGDLALRRLSNCIQDAVTQRGETGDFIGHIGGDDFILITRPQSSLSLCHEIIGRFLSVLPELHGQRDFNANSYTATNRRGEVEVFPLMALSIGIVSTEVNHFDSFAEVASVASEVKKAAKNKVGSSIVRDRRLV